MWKPIKNEVESVQSFNLFVSETHKHNTMQIPLEGISEPNLPFKPTEKSRS